MNICKGLEYIDEPKKGKYNKIEMDIILEEPVNLVEPHSTTEMVMEVTKTLYNNKKIQTIKENCQTFDKEMWFGRYPLTELVFSLFRP